MSGKRGMSVSKFMAILDSFQKKTPEEKEEILRQCREFVAKKDD